MSKGLGKRRSLINVFDALFIDVFFLNAHPLNKEKAVRRKVTKMCFSFYAYLKESRSLQGCKAFKVKKRFDSGVNIRIGDWFQFLLCLCV